MLHVDGRHFDLSGRHRRHRRRPSSPPTASARVRAALAAGDLPVLDVHRPAGRRADRPARRGALHRAELRRARRRVRRRAAGRARSSSTRHPTPWSARRRGADPARLRPRPTGRWSWPWSSAGGPATWIAGEALAHVAGYMVANDVSERDFQLEQSGGQWSKGKSLRDLQPARPVAGHRRRGGRPAGPAACARGSTASPGRTPAPAT